MDNKPLENGVAVVGNNPISDAMTIVFNTYEITEFLCNLQDVILDYHHLALNHYLDASSREAVLRNVEMLTVLSNELRYRQQQIADQIDGEN